MRIHDVAAHLLHLLAGTYFEALALLFYTLVRLAISNATFSLSDIKVRARG